MKKVSIIIPVYNVEKYLKQCLDSASNQTLKDIEIICVNDGSTDRSYEILQEAARNDDRIRLIDKFNSGYGNTMNIGIDAAEGEYIVFLESDDYVLPEMCEDMLRLCEEQHLDILKTDYYTFRSNEENTLCCYMQTSYHDNYHKILNAREDRSLFLAAMYTWTCMYKREFLNRNGIRHNETPGASFQDNGFWFQTLMYAERVYLLDKAYYMYRQDNPNSSIHNKTKIYAFSEEYRFIREKIMEYHEDRTRLLYICSLFNLNHNTNQLLKSGEEYIEELIELICREYEKSLSRAEWNAGCLKDLGFVENRLQLCRENKDELKRRIERYHVEHLEKEKKLAQYSTIILYGAGTYARQTISTICSDINWNGRLLCAVTSLKTANVRVKNIHIEELHQLQQYKKEALLVICANPESAAFTQMYDTAEELGFSNITDVSAVLMKDIWNIMD